MEKKHPSIVLTLVVVIVGAAFLGLASWYYLSSTSRPPIVTSDPTPAATAASGYAGSWSCRECHEKFYQLWAPSHHGLAMQPLTPEFLKTKLEPQKAPITIKDHRYLAVFQDGQAFVQEQGPQIDQRYPMVHAMGGKNVYYFLTPLERGRLQVLPLAYDVRKKEWFDTTSSMIRHFAEGVQSDPVSWQDPLLTFNTACYSCHVSQLDTNYDLKTDTYNTQWLEPGINCESCHGPSREHNRVCKEAPPGTIPSDLKIIRGGKSFTTAQNNDTCSSCHAKAMPLAVSYPPGALFFDHFDLVTLEDPDYYPDGRDLGENYTLTSWLLSPCVKSGKLSCLHCHTSSGRYRFKDESKANQACLPCHQQRVDQAAAHIHHPLDKPGTPSKCISCHMPMTEFARMRRSDHSMLPPTPAATRKFNSPNACNLCHQDKDAAWADRQVRQWHKKDYQAPVLHRAGLVDEARRREWTRLPDMLKYIADKNHDPVFASSLIRLLGSCPDQRMWPVLQQSIQDSSPLVRGAAAAALEAHLTPVTVKALLASLGDSSRLVRLRAANALAAYPAGLLNPDDRARLAQATKELLDALQARPDDWASHYNQGNFYSRQQHNAKALEAFSLAHKLRPDVVLPLVNASLVYARTGKNDQAEESLRQALQLDPNNAAASFNLGLLLAEQGKTAEAEDLLRQALKSDPKFPEAAYNLGVLLAKDRLPEALPLLRQARQLRPQEPKYAFTLAYFLNKHGDRNGALSVLSQQVQKQAANAEVFFLLGELYELSGKEDKAKQVYDKALSDPGLPHAAKLQVKAKLQALNVGSRKR
jgi:tetratricopeptide (TPR) repeat protein